MLKHLKRHPLQKNASGAGDNLVNRVNLANPDSDNKRLRGGQIICLVSVGPDRRILTCSGSGEPELLRLILIQTINIARDRPPPYVPKPRNAS